MTRIVPVACALALIGCAPPKTGGHSIGTSSSGADGGGVVDDGGSSGDGSAGAGDGSPGGASAGDGGTTPTAMPQTLGVLPRQQWEENNGYCAETSLQSIALYYGAWLSQEAVRTAANQAVALPTPGNDASYAAQSQVLIGWDTSLEAVPSPSGEGNNMEKALALLHVDFDPAADEWQQAGHDASDFEVWLKGNLAVGVPVIFAAYVADAGSDSSLNYDHIMPMFGVGYSMLGAFDSGDTFTWASNFDPDGTSTSLVAPRAASTLFSQSMQAQPKSARCQYQTLDGGCIPEDKQYGYAIRGFGNALPVQITAVAAMNAPGKTAANGEPDLPNGDAAITMGATIQCGGLTVGKQYAVQKFDYSLADIHGANADGSTIFATPTSTMPPFAATAAQFTFSDTFSSDHAVYWRCVAQ